MTPVKIQRDTRCSISHFKKVAERTSKYNVLNELKRKYMSRRVPVDCVRVALAKYSGGETIEEVLKWLDYAVSYQLEIYNQWDYHFDSFDNYGYVTEILSAAVLIGRAKELSIANDRVTADIDRSPGDKLLVSFITAILIQDRKHKPSAIAIEDLRILSKKDLGILQTYELFVVADSKSKVKFSRALEAYLRDYWTQIGNYYLGYLEEKINLYFGQWCLVAAALCKLRGFIPQFAPELQAFIPVELILM